MKKKRDLHLQIYWVSDPGTKNSETSQSLQQYLVPSMDFRWGFPQHWKPQWKLWALLSLFLAKVTSHLRETFQVKFLPSWVHFLENFSIGVNLWTLCNNKVLGKNNNNNKKILPNSICYNQQFNFPQDCYTLVFLFLQCLAVPRQTENVHKHLTARSDQCWEDAFPLTQFVKTSQSSLRCLSTFIPFSFHSWIISPDPVTGN